MNLVEQIKNAKSISVNMFNNILIIDGEIIQTSRKSFSCNWQEQKIVECIEHKVFNAHHHNTSIKIGNDKINLPIYNYVLLRTESNQVISIGYYEE